MTAVAAQLAAASPSAVVREATWTRADVATTLTTLPPADLDVAGYVFGELPAGALDSVIRRLTDVAPTVVVVAGTPRGFETVRVVRTLLVTAGRTIAAPCPHARRCPMAGGDWCHLATRLPRSATHRRVKAGDLGYEDGSTPTWRPRPLRLRRHCLGCCATRSSAAGTCGSGCAPGTTDCVTSR